MFLETKRKTDNNGIFFIGNRNDYDLVLNGEKYKGALPRDYELFLKSILEI